MRVMGITAALAGHLHFPARGIECDTGVKQQRGRIHASQSLSRLGRQTAGETSCLAPIGFAFELPSTTSAIVSSLFAYTLHATTKFQPRSYRDVDWTSG
jgi:hypothetical protein